jgi:glycosyltransferase involved in cell wall biosynthesis
MTQKDSAPHLFEQPLQAPLSVIVCAHNPRPDYLGRVLASLRGQTLPVEEWELLLIDNVSSPPLAETWDISWHSRGRHIREDELGLTPARLRGAYESHGHLLIFVDCDNVLAPDFLEQAAAIFAGYPLLGVFGAGILKPEFEVPPPPKLRSRLHMLGLRNLPTALWSNNTQDVQSVPWGAGLCVARPVANFYPQFVADLGITPVLDRRGQRLFSGGDDLYSRVAAELDLGFGVFPELRVTHLISAPRLDQRYILRLIHDHSFSHGLLAFLLDGIQPGRIDSVRYLRLLLHSIKNGQFSMRCQWAASRGADGAAQYISTNRLRRLKFGRNSLRQEPRNVFPFQPSTCSDSRFYGAE